MRSLLHASEFIVLTILPSETVALQPALLEKGSGGYLQGCTGIRQVLFNYHEDMRDFSPVKKDGFVWRLEWQETAS